MQWLIQFLGNIPLFFAWKIIDLIKYRPHPPYGIRVYLGCGGDGKTISMAYRAWKLKKKFPKMKIYTNYNLGFQDGDLPLKWEDIAGLRNGKDGVLIQIDEGQNEFNSRNWANFPPKFFEQLTTCRKDFMEIDFTSQYAEAIDKQIRTIAHYLIDCYTWGGRWTWNKAFRARDYRDGVDSQIGRKRLRAFVTSFIQTDKVRAIFDTYLKPQDLKKMKENPYIKPENQIIVNQLLNVLKK